MAFARSYIDPQWLQTWASMAPRSELDNAMYQFVARNLKALAALMQPPQRAVA